MLVIEYPSDCQHLFDEHKEELSSVEFGRKGNIIGSSDTAIAMMTLTATLAPFITKIVIEIIKNKRNVSIKYNGNVVTGLSEKAAERIIKEMINNHD